MSAKPRPGCVADTTVGEGCWYINRIPGAKRGDFCEEPVIGDGLAYCVMHELLFRADHPEQTSAGKDTTYLNEWELRNAIQRHAR